MLVGLRGGEHARLVLLLLPLVWFNTRRHP